MSPLPARGVQQCSLQTHNTVFVDGHAIELALRVACALFLFPNNKIALERPRGIAAQGLFVTILLYLVKLYFIRGIRMYVA